MRCETGGLDFLTEVSRQPTCVLGVAASGGVGAGGVGFARGGR